MSSGGGRERLWRSRLRWRIQGPWLWPAFVVLTFAAGVLLQRLPFYGAGPGTLMGGVLLAGVANLLLVAVVAPFGGRWLRRIRTDLPRQIASDYAGTGLLVLFVALLVAGGVAHRPFVQAQAADRRAQLMAVHDYVLTQAPSHQPWLGSADSMRIENDVYRTCIPGPDPKRPLCLIVNTDQVPAGVRVDSDRAPNAVYRMHGGFE